MVRRRRRRGGVGTTTGLLQQVPTLMMMMVMVMLSSTATTLAATPEAVGGSSVISTMQQEDCGAYESCFQCKSNEGCSWCASEFDSACLPTQACIRTIPVCPIIPLVSTAGVELVCLLLLSAYCCYWVHRRSSGGGNNNNNNDNNNQRHRRDSNNNQQQFGLRLPLVENGNGNNNNVEGGRGDDGGAGGGANRGTMSAVVAMTLIVPILAATIIFYTCSVPTSDLLGRLGLFIGSVPSLLAALGVSVVLVRDRLFYRVPVCAKTAGWNVGGSIALVVAVLGLFPAYAASRPEPESTLDIAFAPIYAALTGFGAIAISFAIGTRLFNEHQQQQQQQQQQQGGGGGGGGGNVRRNSNSGSNNSNSNNGDAIVGLFSVGGGGGGVGGSNGSGGGGGVTTACDPLPMGMGGCIICFETRADMLLTPCRHLCLCEKCSKKSVTECPYCRGKVEGVTKIFHPA